MPKPDENKKQRTLLSPPPRNEDPQAPNLTLKEKGPSPYSDEISLDRGKLSLNANGILQPDLKTPTEIIKIDPHAENIDPKRFNSFKAVGEAALDYDGSPDAYMPNDIGSDHLSNAFSDSGAEAGVRQAQTNYLGGYLSTTTWKRGPNDRQSSYVDSRKVPYVAMPGSYFKKETGGKVGDFVHLTNKITKISIWAVVADNRMSRDKGIEMSIAAARSLGIGFNRNGTTKNSKQISLEAFKGSASGRWYE